MKTGERLSAAMRSAAVLLLLLWAVFGPAACEKQPAAEPSSDAPSGQAQEAPDTVTPDEPPAGSSDQAASMRPVPPAAASTENLPPADGPRITFQQMTVDLGVISNTGKETARYAFTNTGGETLIIEDMKASCGCTVPSLPKYTYQPGERGELEVVFDPKRKHDKQKLRITVISNAEPEGLIRLWLHAFVQPFIRFDKEFLRLGTITLGQERRALVQMEYTDPGLVVEDVASTHPFVRAEMLSLVEHVEGGAYRGTIEVTIGADAPWGTLYQTRVQVRARGRIEPDAEPIEYSDYFFVVGNVFGNIHANPPIIGMNVIERGRPFEDSVMLHSVDGSPFEIVQAEIRDATTGQANVRIEPVSESRYRVVVYGEISSSFRGPVRGAVVLKTNLPDEETLTIHFVGHVL